MQSMNPAGEVSITEIAHGVADVVEGIADNAVSKIEVYYTASENNKTKLQDLGVTAKLYAYEDCSYFDYYSSRRRKRGSCPGYLDYVRAGVLDVGGLIGIQGHSGAINNITVTMYEAMSEEGTYFHIMRVGYVKDNRSQFLNFAVPFSVGLGQNLDIKLTPGGALKIFLNGEFEGGLGFYRLEDHVRYAEKVDDKINYEVQRGFLAFAQLRGRAGIKFFDRVALGAVGGVGIQTPGLYENIYGGELRVQITKNFSINANAF